LIRAIISHYEKRKKRWAVGEQVYDCCKNAKLPSFEMAQ